MQTNAVFKPGRKKLNHKENELPQISKMLKQ